MKKFTTNYRNACRGWLMTALALLWLGGSAQPTGSPRRITGKIIDQVSQEAVVSASVTVRSTGKVSTTDASGVFTVEAATGDILEITSVGYVRKEVKVPTGDYMEIRIETDYSNLEGVVVVGYGKMKKTDLSSSQVTVNAEDMKRTVNTTFDQALQGRAANVYVTQGSGQPGAAPSVIIRGISSLTGSTQPLYVIDGVQIKPENPADNPYSHPAGFANVLSGINPDDIETINVLQGPSATAIFGSVGANGVIMITTKRGKSGQTKISFNTLWTIQDKPDYIPVMNLQEYAIYRNEFARAGGAPADPNFGDPKILGKGTDWQDALFRRTLLQKHSLSLSGGNDKTTFYFSGEYFNQEGIAPGSGFSRYSVRLNLDNQTLRWLKIGTNLSVNQTQEKVNTTNAGIISLAIQQNPSIPVKNPDGSWGGPDVTQYAFSNPVALAYVNDDHNKSLGFVGGAYADITIRKGLVLHNEINGNIQYANNYQFHPSYEFGNYINATTTSSRSANNNYWWGLNTRLQYDTKIGKHGISAMLAHEAQSWGYEGLSGARNNFVTNDVQELSGGDATTATNGSSRGDGARESYFGRVNYVYNSKYILQGTYRYDGASVFGANKRWGGFPSVSAAWRISQEDFMKDIMVINDLKLRVEYGWSGNSNAQGYYARLQAVPTGWGTGFLSQNFSNPNMQWEVDKTANVGFDLNMFQNRLEVIFDAYVKNISKLLTTNPYAFYNGGDISYSPGYISWPTTNVGSMQNKGFGVTVNSVNISQKDFIWKTSLNVSHDKSKITELITPINFAYVSSQAEFLTEVGNAPSLITGYIAEGLFTDYNDIRNHAMQASSGVISPSQGTWVGDIKFKDLNKDGVIDQNDRTVIGNPWPDFTFGLNNSFTYRNFDINIFITGSVGNDILNYSRYQNESPLGTGPYSNYYKSVANFARPSSINLADSLSVTLLNPGYNIPRIAPGDPNGNNRISQWDVEDGSYLRVKNISIAYNFSSRLISKYSLRGLRLAINVQNLLTLTGYKGYDPEIGLINYGGTIMAGLDSGRYPNVRMYSVNLVADF